MVKIITLVLLILQFASYAFSAENDDVSASGEVSKAITRLKEEGAEFLAQPIMGKNLVPTLGIMAATSLTFVFDKEISEKLNRIKGSRLDKAAEAGSLAGNPFLHLGLAAGIYGWGIASESPKWKEVGEMAMEALILADASTFIIKEASGRGRPSKTAGKGDFHPFSFKTDYDSFPSMHTASSFALASVMAATTENLAAKAVYYSGAAFVGFSRLYEKKHWASDALFGALLGEVCGRTVTYFHASGSKLALAPLALENGAGITMVKKW